jgi:hypothetical protein
MTTMVVTPGTCRVCGCTETTPCHVLIAPGEYVGCAWLDVERTLCSNPRCVAVVPLEELMAMSAGA